MSAPQEVGILAALLGLRSVHKTVPVARIGERTVRLTQPVRALAGPGPVAYVGFTRRHLYWRRPIEEVSDEADR